MSNPNEEFNGDPWVQEVQIWYNTEYQGKTGYVKIENDGIVGPGTCKALIRALQIELGISSPNGTFGPSTSKLFENVGINEHTTNSNLIKILQGGFLCKGIDCRGFDGVYDQQLEFAIEDFRNMTGIPGKVMDARHMKALLNTDPFVLQGKKFIRNVQQFLNATYSDCFWKNIGLIPCNGIPERNMTKSIVYALQYEEAVAAGSVTPGTIPSSVDGIVGTNTLNKAPVLSSGSTKSKFVKILQAALACMHLTDTGLHGTFNADVQQAVSDFQKFMCLNQDSSVTLGTVDRKTWASLLISKGDVSRYANGCDCATILDLEKAQALKATGYDYVGRYLTGTVLLSNKQRVSKALTREEISAITTAGLNIFAIYQDGGASASYFKYEQGYSDAKRAYEAARELLIPYGEIIYFAVDYDFTDKQTTNIVIPHFKGINDYFSEKKINYKIGVYGARNICSRVSNEELACSSFVADMSTGYSGNMGFRMPENWAFDQIQEYNFSYTSHGTNPFSLDRDVVSGRYTGFNTMMGCGGKDCKDATQHIWKDLGNGKLRCLACGREVLIPYMQDADILSDDDQLLVKGLTLGMSQACVTERGKNVFEYALWAMARDVRAKDEYIGKYEYQDADGHCLGFESDLNLNPTAYEPATNRLVKVDSQNIIRYSPLLAPTVNYLLGFVLGSVTGTEYLSLLSILDWMETGEYAISLNSVLQIIMEKLGAPEFASLLGLLGYGVEIDESQKEPQVSIGDYVIYATTALNYSILIVFDKNRQFKFTRLYFNE